MIYEEEKTEFYKINKKKKDAYICKCSKKKEKDLVQQWYVK